MTLVVPRLESLLELRGGPGASVLGLRFVGITFAHTARPATPRGFAGLQAGFFDLRPEEGPATTDRAPPSAVRAEYTIDCAFERCRFEHLGGAALWLGAGCRRDVVRRCVVSDVGSTGILLGTPDEPAAADLESLATDLVLEDTVVERAGAIDFGAVGIWVGIAARCTVQHNELRDLPYTGVSLGWIWDPRPSPSHGHRIEHNHIHHVMQILSDGGGIYVLGRQPGSALRANLIHDVPVNAGRAESNGIFLDEGCCELLVEENVIHSLPRSPIRFHRVGSNLLRNNVLVAAEGVAPFQYHACSPDDQVFDGNQLPNVRQWAPPLPRSFGAGPR